MSTRPALPNTTYGVLGMLSLAPMSGYELAQNVDKTIAHFWTISKSQVYGELARLEELGLATATDVAQERAPDKRIYELTEDGARALDDWLGKAGTEPSRMRSPQLLKMFFAHRLPRERYEDLLDGYADAARAHVTHLQTIVDLLSSSPDAFFARATAIVGLRTAEATLAAVAEIKATIPKRSGKASDKGAKEMLERTPALAEERRI